MASPKLRAYQRTAIESARRALTKSGSCILQMPTGAGKTRAATEIVATSRGVIWFVCHRREIERQVAAAFTAAGIDFGIVSPRGELEPKKRVQIVSVHTLPKRMKLLPSPKMVIWDECHHVAAKSWANIRNKLKDARHLGLTATPERLDGRGLGEWFSELVTGPGIAELIKKGFLSEFRYFAPSDPDLTKAKIQAGDYKKSDLGRVMNTPVLIGDAVREYKKNAKGKRALAFCASVAASHALAAKFNGDGIKAAHIDGTTPTVERDAAIANLAAGRIKVLCNVEVLTEGFDVPAIDAVILMRPTKSPTLLLQMIGRGLRKAPGKDVAIIMDHAGLHRDHEWFANDWHWSLDGGAARARRAAVERGPRRCPECKEVRAERAEVCACGYEFPTGREVGEFDGVLTEVRGVVPDGLESLYAFARRFGIKNLRYSKNKLLAMGLPMTSDGRVDAASGAAWMRANWRSRHSPPTEVSDYTEYESQMAFAKRCGVSQPTIKKLRNSGELRSAQNGWIHIACGADWMQKNFRSNQVRPAIADGCEYQPMQWLSKKYSISRKELKSNERLIRADNGWINITKSIGFIEELAARHKNSRETPGRVLDSSSYEMKKDFADRVMASRSVVTIWGKRGIPMSPNGWIHIQRGLEWVRDNADIKIPASAWPKKAARAKRNTGEHQLAA